MFTVVIRRLQAIDFTAFSQCTKSAVIRVPGTSGRRVRMAPVRNDYVARVQMCGRHSETPERQRHDVAREPLAVTRNRVDGARRKLAQHRQSLDQFGQLLKVLVQKMVQTSALFER